MPYYQLYALSSDDRVVDRCELAAPDDETAIARSAAAFPGQMVEIYQGGRCVLASAQGAHPASGPDLHRAVDLIA